MFLARQVSAVVAKQLKQEAEKLTEERLSHSVETTYGIYNRKIEGLETYIALLEKNFKSYSTSNKPRGRAGWGFFKSAEYDGRGSFLPQHSGLEMTNGKSMNFMQSFQSVCKRVIGMYAPDQDSTSPPSLQDMAMHAWLKKWFGKIEIVAKILFKIMVFIKSQEKRDPNNLRDLLFEFSIAWCNAFPDKNTFNKLHFLLYHLPGYVEFWEMLGIISEESFEAFHAKLCKTKGDLKGMPCTTARVNTTNARTQNLLNPEIMKLTLQVEAGTTGNKTGKQNNKRERDSDKEMTYITTNFGTEVIEGEQYIVLTDNSFLSSKRYKDYFLFFGSSRVPSTWMTKFNGTDELTSQEQINLQYTTAMK